MKPGNDTTYILYRCTWTDEDGSRNEGFQAAKGRRDVQLRLSRYEDVEIVNIGTVEVRPYHNS